jgi:hypothetical protein
VQLSDCALAFVGLHATQMRCHTRMGGEEECRAAFALFDADSSGTIDENELRELAAQLGASMSADDVRAVMHEIDVDGSGEIDVEEFTAWWTKDAKARGLGARSGGSPGLGSVSLLAGLRTKVKGAVHTAERTVLISGSKLKLQVDYQSTGAAGGRATLAKWEFKQVEVILNESTDRFELRGCGEKTVADKSFLLQMRRQAGKQAQASDERDALYYCWRVLSGAEQLDYG